MRTIDKKILVSFICVYNSERFFKLMFNSIKLTNISYDYEIVGIDNTNNQYKSMVAALTAAQKKANGNIMVFLHQDVVFSNESNLNWLIENCVKKCALYGVFGVENYGASKKSISSITDLWCEYDGLKKDEIREVFTIDECLFACNKKLLDKINFDSKLCKHWDFYAVDLALQCQLANIPVYSIGLKLIHYSKGNTKTKAFKSVEKRLINKYRNNFSIITYPCGWSYTSHAKIFKQQLFKLYASVRRFTKTLGYKMLHPKTFSPKIHRFFHNCSQHLSLKFDIQKDDKKIVFVTHSTSKTGAPLLGYNIVKELIRKKYKVTTISLDIDGEGNLYKDFKRVSTHFFSKPSSKTLRLLKNKGYKRYIFNSFASAPILSKIYDKDVDATFLIHELPDVIMKLDLVKYIETVDKCSKTIIFPSNFTKNRYEEKFGKNKSYTIVRPQGIYQCKDIDISREEAKKEICKMLNIDLKKEILLCVGTGDERKGVDLFYKLASNMVRQKKYEFVWIGPFYYKLESQYIDLPNVYHIKYVDSEELLYKFYKSATFYLMISRSEPFGTVVLESFSAGTPVIAFDNAGGYLDVLKNNSTGFLVKYLDLNNYMQVIVKKRTTKELLNVINNAKKVLSNFKFSDYVTYLIDTLFNLKNAQ